MAVKHRKERRRPEEGDGVALLDLVRSMPLAVLVADPLGTPLLASSRFRALLGEPPAAGWLALTEPADRARAEALWLAAGVECGPCEATLTLCGPTGPLPARCSIAPIEAEGRLLGWAILLSEPVADLSGALREAEARLAAEEARRAEAEARLAAEEARRAETADRLTAERAGRAEVEARLARAETELAQVQARLAWAETELGDAEARLGLAEGRRREAEARRVEGEARLAQTVLRLREAEDRREAAERAARARLDALPQRIWTANADGTPDRANEAWRHFTGAEEPADWLALVHPEDSRRVLGLWGYALATGEPFAAEHRLRHREGGHRPVLTRAQPVWDEGGSLLGWVGTCADLPRPAPTLEPDPESEGKRLAAAPEPDGAGGPRPDDVAGLSQVAGGAAQGSEAGTPGGPAEEQPAPPAPQGPPNAEELDRLASRLRSPALREALVRWREAGSPARMPRPEGWDGPLPSLSGQLIAEFGGGAPVRVRAVQPVAETTLLQALASRPGAEAASWRRCAETGQPVHDFVSIRLDEQRGDSLERLLLPLSSDGVQVDALVILIAMGLGEETAPARCVS